MIELTEVRAVLDFGLDGDIAASGRPGGNRQVSLMQAEHLPVVAALADVSSVTPSAARRNLVVAGINLLTLVGVRFSAGSAVLVGTGRCAPCGRMDETIGPLGFQAMRGHGGITARIEQGGVIRLGSEVRMLGPATPEG
jgi:MOSC domain-containing protein YiiM